MGSELRFNAALSWLARRSDILNDDGGNNNVIICWTYYYVQRIIALLLDVIIHPTLGLKYSRVMMDNEYNDIKIIVRINLILF